ncbi:MAG: hypothetical protein WC934_02765 [Acidithiobacillus sp.]|jgi:hypothetical protein|uniref:hypothetical protein n=1 Tax=Acidithiobacillus sp. TaxID=1872118 RepID=UPI00355CFC14
MDEEKKEKRISPLCVTCGNQALKSPIAKNLSILTVLICIICAIIFQMIPFNSLSGIIIICITTFIVIILSSIFINYSSHVEKKYI